MTATSGKKNLIMIIDISGSMSGTRLTLAKEAAKSVVNTLSNNDFVGIVTFSSTATNLGPNRITRATS